MLHFFVRKKDSVRTVHCSQKYQTKQKKERKEKREKKRKKKEEQKQERQKRTKPNKKNHNKQINTSDNTDYKMCAQRCLIASKTDSTL